MYIEWIIRFHVANPKVSAENLKRLGLLTPSLLRARFSNANGISDHTELYEHYFGHVLVLTNGLASFRKNSTVGRDSKYFSIHLVSILW